MIYTSYFQNVKKVLWRYPKAFLCSIAGKTPKQFLDYAEQVKAKNGKFKSLMPKYSWWDKWHKKFENDLESDKSQLWYENKYRQTVLDKLEPKNIE